MKNVTLEEKKIGEFAYIYAKSPLDDKQYNAEIYVAVISGAKSDAAKEYHTKGMFTQEQVFKLLKESQYAYHKHQHPESIFDLKQWFYDNAKTV